MTKVWILVIGYHSYVFDSKEKAQENLWSEIQDYMGNEEIYPEGSLDEKIEWAVDRGIKDELKYTISEKEVH